MDELEPVKKAHAHTVGEDIASLSVDELEERVEALRTEIERIRQEIEAKGQTRSAADALFK